MGFVGVEQDKEEDELGHSGSPFKSPEYFDPAFVGVGLIGDLANRRQGSD
jgi:hypothetical protein